MRSDIFVERLEECRTTYQLNLGYCNIDALPDEFVSTVNKYNPYLLELDLTSNQLTNLPPDLHQLKCLRALRVKYNRLPDFPAVCFRLERCMTLDLAGNQIEAIPDDVVCLRALRELDVSGNRISTCTGQLDQLVHLSTLSLEDNQLKALPEAIGLCPSLVKLKCSTNLLRALPASMGNLKKAQRLDFANNHILKVPPVIGHLKALKELNLRYNPLEPTYQRAADEGLSKFLAFLKKEEAREDAEARERLRPIGTQAGSFTEYRCKSHQASSQMNKHASDPSAASAADDASGGLIGDEVDNRPWTRVGATLCKHHDTFYLFGGSVIRDSGRKSMELYVLCTDTMAWRRQVTSGDGRPAARSDHCAVIDPDTERLIIFGGRSQDKKRLNDVWALDLNTLRWFKQNCSGAAPRPRDKAAAVFCQGHMVVFGGHTTGKRLNDLCVLDLTSFTWTSWTSVMGQPSPRESAALCVGHGNMLFLHGGASNFGLDDLWVYDQKLQAWIEVAAEGARPPARRGHSLYMHNGRLHLFGGIDELGAPSTAMFRVAVEYGLNLSTVRLRWEELVSERIFNPNRMVAFDEATVLSDGCARSAGQIMCFQLGSRLLGPVATEDLDRGNAYFDVFAIADLASLAVKAQAAVAAAPQHGKRLRVEHTVNQIAKMPRSYSTNSPAEERLEEYLREYAVVFTELYRHRRPLYFMPQNECCVKKCVCTTIRPTKLPFLETYDLAGAVAFVSNAIAYEPPENSLHPPEHLLSPQSVLSFQAGDSFDMASLLVSLLLGCGYDAYVVGGYAPSDIAQNDQSSQTCPLLEAEFSLRNKEAETSGPATSQGVEAGTKYEVKAEVEFVSEFERSLQLAAHAEAAKLVAAGAAATAQAEAEERERELDSLRIARNQGQRFIHAWVLVKAGARGMVHDTFVEVTSGRQYSPSTSPYTGIEWVWNHENFWIAMDLPEPHSDARLNPARALFDLWDPHRWEAVLPRLRPPLPAEEFGAAGSEGGEMSADGNSDVSPAAPGTGTLRSMTVSRQKSAAPRADGEGVAGTLRFGGKLDTAAAAASDAPALIEMPESWVPRLTVTRDMLDMRVPKGSKKTVYRVSEHEIFALFGETSKFDGSLERLTVFTDEEHQVKLEDREYYARRKDKLREKRRYYDESGSLKSFVEHYDCGSAYGIRTLWQFFSVNDEGESVLTRQVGEYYAAARLDFLVRKEEVIGVKAIETYSDRPDFLVYRSATYGPMPPGNDSVDKPQPLVKMTEKFRRNHAVPAQGDVQRRVFYLAQASIRIDYHVPENSLTHSYRVYTKQGRSHVVQSDPLLPPVDTIAQLEQFQQLVAAEKECMTCIRQNEWETKEFGKVRKLLNEAVSLVTPYYDIARINADESDDEEAEAPEATYDYLSPFLPNISGTRGLTREEALHVREVCLRALKERLIERANIIQARHDEEAAALAKRRTNFQRDRDQLAKEAEAEYEEACERAAFKLQILEKRLKHHEEQAIRKYYELDHQLRKDPRLSALVQ